MTRASLLAALAPVLACSPRPATADPESCAPVSEAPGPAAPAASLAGDYRLRLVATSGPRQDSSADGSLTLEPAPAPDDTARRRPALFGAADVRLEDVGAPTADLASRDPMRPGVLGFELASGTDEATSPRVILRLGAEANRQDVVRVEGASTVLRVREVREDGFGGEWTANAPLPVAEGYFCAWRAAADTSAVDTARAE
ncbi:MAG TPA: hypothetical protein VEB59_00400 [Gemmatimonadales bacterium]|nr:hypothetical protein [Gemmatimonadales bacterium]